MSTQPRIYDGEQEIWIRGWSQEGAIWLIYKPDTQEWETILRRIDDTDTYSGNLFLTEDGTIWSRTQWSRQPQLAEFETVPVLSRFNEDTRRFETTEVPIEVPVIQEPQYYYGQAVSPWPEIILDEQESIFWIIINFDGIYRYDPAQQTVDRRLDIDFPIDTAVLAPNGNLYFSRPNQQIDTTKALFTLSEGMLLQFNPELGNIEIMEVPDDWPIFNGLVVDRDGRLWLGSIGYLDLDGIWQLIHTNVETYFDNVGDYTWSSPTIILHSSDGRLWFNRYLDGGGEGTAWYDPELGEGCLFYGGASDIVEDSSQTLWMITYTNLLYRYDLNSH